MSKMIPMALMMVMPVAGMAQNKSGLKAENFDKTVKPADRMNLSSVPVEAP